MRRYLLNTTRLLTLCVPLLFVTACADQPADEALPTTDPETTTAPDTAVVPEEAAPLDTPHLLVAEQAPYGAYLTDVSGRALYLFTADEQGQSSACYDDCAEAWPPLYADEPPVAAGEAVQASLIGTIERRDGRMQVTYNGWPLYYYQQDQAAGQLTGQDIHSFGGGWYLVSPQGEQIEAEE